LEDAVAQPINRYKADLRDFHFLLFEQFGLGDILGKEPFAAWGEDEIKLVLDEIYRFSCDVTGPLNQLGDAQGCRIENGQVIAPDGFAEAWKQVYEAGWKSLVVPDEFGGQAAPHSVAALSEELLSGSNTSFNMYPGLTVGAAEVIAEFGTERQKKLYAQRMYDGQWAGTMCLTEAHAGSDVGAATTSATRNDDGTYNIKGGKIFISAGDHDMAENVVHLVLARIEGAMPGTKGLSLFIVPKHRVTDDGTLTGPNDVSVAAIEHKMGINGSATAQLQFGEDDACVGELVGTEEHQGIRQMFRMMNLARIAVGIQGLSVASTAYLNALEYSKERKQGPSVKDWKDPQAEKVAIIQHPNIRRMLIDMKARVEGIRALIVKLTVHQDRALTLTGKDDELAAYHLGQIDLLTPLVKAYSSDQAFRVCETAIQVYGGAGYLKDHPVEQYARDSKIFSIYEGTNAIQSLDLVGRKLGQGGGKNTQAFLGDIQKFIDAHKDHARLGASVAKLAKAHEAVAASAMHFLGWFQAGQMERIPLASENFLEMMSELAVGWLLLEQASLADGKLEGGASASDQAFYEGKRQGAIYYALNVLPAVVTKAQILSANDTSPLDIPDEGFGRI
jgi:alkylation response protein AidB-like acyl-CoA dehydrogenase